MGVEALVVDLHPGHRQTRGLLVDVAVAVDLGVVADTLEEPVDDPRRAAPRRAIATGRRRLDPTPRIDAERSTIEVSSFVSKSSR